MGTAREVRIEHFAPAEPDATLIELIHRGHDQHVTFACSYWGWVQGPNVPARELDRWMPTLRQFIQIDGYFSINGMFGASKSRSPWIPELRMGLRGGNQIQWLTACFVDLDVYNAERSIDEAVDRVRELEANGSIPRVSILVRSGRGIWLLWLLRNRENSGPIRYRDQFQLPFSRLQDALASRLKELEPDPKSKDRSRVMRIAGSISSKSETRVSYSIAFDLETNEPISYLFDELAGFVGVSPPKSAKDRSYSLPSLAQRRGATGPEARAKLCLHRFWALAHHRGLQGTPVGVRHHAAWLLAFWLRRVGTARPEAIEIVQGFFDEFCATLDSKGRLDPIASKQAEQTVRSVYQSSARENRLRSQTIADRLDITPTEAMAMDPMGDVPWPPASRFGPIEGLPRSRREKKARDRRKALDSILAEAAVRPSLAGIQVRLAQRGIHATRKTIWRDLRLVPGPEWGRP